MEIHWHGVPLEQVEEDTVVHFPAVTLCSLNSMPHSEYLEEHKWWRAFVELEDQYIEPSGCSWSSLWDFH